MICKNNRKGYALIEAMLSLVLIGSGMAWKAKIDSNYQKDQQVLGVVNSVDSFIYGMDKRVFLDGSTWKGGEFSANNAKDSYALIKKALVGANDTSCAGGGWNATYADNSKTALISCYALNPHNMPFGLDMSVSAKQVVKAQSSTEKTLGRFKVTLFYKTDAAFDKHLNVFLKLYSYSKVMNSPMITGSHKYLLENRDTGGQVTMAECTRLKSKCGFAAEFVTNEAGLSESPYLMVNGDNFMLDDLRFQDSAHPETALNCTTVDDAGVEKSVPCGLDTTGAELNSVSTKSFGTGFYLTDGKSDNPSVRLKCHGVSGAQKACGLVAVGDKSVLRVNTIAVDDLSSNNIVFNQKLSNKNNSFNVDVHGNVQGNDIYGTGSIHSRVSVFADHDRSGRSHTAELDASGLHLKGNWGYHMNVLGGGVVDVNGSAINLNGSIAKTNVAWNRDTNTRALNEYVTKNFLGLYSMVTDIKTNVISGRATYFSSRCLGGRQPVGVFVPKEIPVRSEYSDQARCANAWGQRLAVWDARVIGTNGRGDGYDAYRWKMQMVGSVGCSLSRDSWVRWGATVSGNRVTPYMTFTDYGVNGRGVRNLSVQASGDLILLCPRIH